MLTRRQREMLENGNGHWADRDDAIAAALATIDAQAKEIEVATTAIHDLQQEQEAYGRGRADERREIASKLKGEAETLYAMAEDAVAGDSVVRAATFNRNAEYVEALANAILARGDIPEPLPPDVLRADLLAAMAALEPLSIMYQRFMADDLPGDFVFQISPPNPLTPPEDMEGRLTVAHVRHAAVAYAEITGRRGSVSLS